MGVFVLKAKKTKFRVFIEEWTPTRHVTTVTPQNYPTFNISEQMTLEQAKSAAKEYNLKNKLQKKKDARVTAEAQQRSLLDSFALPEYLVDAFNTELRQEYSHNPERLDTVLQHWSSAKVMLAKLQVEPSQYFEKRFEIFEYYEEKCWSADYIKRITKICNIWGSFYSRKKGTFFEPIPKIGIRIQQIVKKRETKENIRKAATPLIWDELRNLKSSFENEHLSHQWNWLYLGMFFGLRPSEIDNLKNEKYFKIKDDPTNNVTVLLVYQNKLRNLPEAKRWKVIPIVEPEQKECLEIITQQAFKRPLNKTLKRLFSTKGIDTYSPRKGFTDLFLNRGYELEDISVFLGHSSIETTWRHYKNKLVFKLPKKAG